MAATTTTAFYTVRYERVTYEVVAFGLDELAELLDVDPAHIAGLTADQLAELVARTDVDHALSEWEDNSPATDPDERRNITITPDPATKGDPR